MRFLTTFYKLNLNRAFFKFQLNLFFLHHILVYRLSGVTYPVFFMSNKVNFKPQTLKLLSFYFWVIVAFFLVVILFGLWWF